MPSRRAIRRRTQKVSGLSRQDVLEQIQTAARVYGDGLTFNQFHAATGLAYWRIGRLGGWQALRAAAGLPRLPTGPRQAIKYTEAMLREQAQKLFETYGPRLTLMEFYRRTGIDHSTFRRHCGNWGDFRVSIGLPRNKSGPRRQYTDFDLLSALHEVSAKLGRLPNEREFNQAGKMKYRLVHDRFGRRAEVRQRLLEFCNQLKTDLDAVVRAAQEERR
jgi:hypothetical protein